MKILFAPYNVASMPGITAIGLNSLDGIEARCYNLGHNKIVSSNEFTLNILEVPFKKNPFQWARWKFKKYYHLIRLILWADVIHWTWDSIVRFDLDLRLIKWLQKPAVVEFVGSDIRIPSLAGQYSPWYKIAFTNGYEYASIESEEKSLKLQKKFSFFGFVPVLVPEMQLYLNRELFPKAYTTQWRIPTQLFSVKYPCQTVKRITIVHSPSAKIAKGTNYIMPVLERLKAELDVEYRIIHNMPRAEALKVVEQADIFIDQIILGMYGMAALEAMSMGKPVVAFLMDKLFENNGFPEGIPIVNANANTLFEKLKELVENPKKCYDIGRASRKWVEQSHDTILLSKDLVDTYTNVIQNKRGHA